MILCSCKETDNSKWIPFSKVLIWESNFQIICCNHLLYIFCSPEYAWICICPTRVPRHKCLYLFRFVYHCVRVILHFSAHINASLFCFMLYFTLVVCSFLVHSTCLYKHSKCNLIVPPSLSDFTVYLFVKRASNNISRPYNLPRRKQKQRTGLNPGEMQKVRSDETLNSTNFLQTTTNQSQDKVVLKRVKCIHLPPW